ncbi:unnamed protein product [Caenorhabditis brenneri]
MSSDTKCASPNDIDRFSNANFMFSQIVHLIAISATFFLAYFAAKLILQRTIFETSTKILLLQSLAYSVLFQICHGIEVFALFYKGFFKIDQPCELLQSEAHCYPHFSFYICSTSGIICGQTGLMIERACATYFKNYIKETRLRVGWFIFIMVFLLSAASGPLIVLDDPLQGYSFACFVIPKQSVPRATRFYIICTILTLLNLIASVFIMQYNKRYEYVTRFKVGARFQKRQAIESTGTICFLALSLFVFLFIYSLGINILVNIRSKIPPSFFSFFITWCFTMPFVAAMIPLLIICRVTSARANRVQNISGITQERQTQEDHMQQMRAMWS